jgi:hypothetical protein
MARKSNAEDRVLAFFEEQPLEVARVVLNIAQGVVKRRSPQTETKPKKRGPGRKTVQAPATEPTQSTAAVVD